MKFCGLLLAIFLMSCAPQHTSIAGNQGARLQKSEIDFSTVKAQILERKCVGCHLLYSDYSSVQREARVILAAVTGGRMPKGGAALKADDLKLLEEWVRAGTPEKAGDGPNLPGPVVLEASWESLFKYVIGPRCLVCHNPNGQAKFLDLSEYGSVVAARDRPFEGKKLLDVAQPEQSYLLSIVRDPDEPMPPKKSNIPLLTSAEVAALREWIQSALPLR